jgi:hypothetical protein
MLQLLVGGRRKTPPRKLLGLQTREGCCAEKEVAEYTQDYNLTTRGMSFAAALRGKTEEQQKPRTHRMAGPVTMEPRNPQTAEKSQSVRAPNVEFVSEQNVESSSNDRTADYGSLMVLC